MPPESGTCHTSALVGALSLSSGPYGEPAVVLVGGEAGVGKTRLIAELTSRYAADRMRVLAGGCVPVGDGALPYAPIVEALRPCRISSAWTRCVNSLAPPGWSWPDCYRAWACPNPAQLLAACRDAF